MCTEVTLCMYGSNFVYVWKYLNFCMYGSELSIIHVCTYGSEHKLTFGRVSALSRIALRCKRCFVVVPRIINYPWLDHGRIAPLIDSIE